MDYKTKLIIRIFVDIFLMVVITLLALLACAILLRGYNEVTAIFAGANVIGIILKWFLIVLLSGIGLVIIIVFGGGFLVAFNRFVQHGRKL